MKKFILYIIIPLILIASVKKTLIYTIQIDPELCVYSTNSYPKYFNNEWITDFLVQFGAKALAYYDIPCDRGLNPFIVPLQLQLGHAIDKIEETEDEWVVHTGAVLTLANANKESTLSFTQNNLPAGTPEFFFMPSDGLQKPIPLKLSLVKKGAPAPSVINNSKEIQTEAGDHYLLLLHLSKEAKLSLQQRTQSFSGSIIIHHLIDG